MKIIKEPMYQQLMKILRSLIQSDRYEIGDKFLTEGEISKTYEVSRNTVNKAVTGLISEGLLEFRKGLGSFIKMKSSQYDLHSLISFTKMAESIGAKATTKVVEFRKIKGIEADIDVRTALQTDDKSPIYYMRRLRLLNNVPSIAEERFVSAALCPALKKGDVSGSIISMWAEKYGLIIEKADQTLRAILLDEEIAEFLQGTRGEPAFMREATGFSGGEKPLWYERTVFRGKDYVFRFQLESMNALQTAKSVFIGDNNI